MSRSARLSLHAKAERGFVSLLKKGNIKAKKNRKTQTSIKECRTFGPFAPIPGYFLFRPFYRFEFVFLGFSPVKIFCNLLKTQEMLLFCVVPIAFVTTGIKRVEMMRDFTTLV